MGKPSLKPSPSKPKTCFQPAMKLPRWIRKAKALAAARTSGHAEAAPASTSSPPRYHAHCLEELHRVISILTKRNSSVRIRRRIRDCPLLIREPGVNMAYIIQSLAHRIATGDVPPGLAHVRLLHLDSSSLLSLLEEVQDDGKVILFIDDIHLVLGGGRNCISSEAAQLFKPMLARGQLWCIGATTLDGYRKYVEKDEGVARRFEQVYVGEPGVEDTIDILNEVKEDYERHHCVEIQYQALVAAVNLSRYINEGRLPEKAMDLVDEASTTARLQLDTNPIEIVDLERRMRVLDVHVHSLEKEDGASIGKLVKVREELDDLRNKLHSLVMKHEKQKGMIDEIRKLKRQREKLLFTLQEAEERKAPNLRDEAFQEINTSIARLERDLRENSMLSETIGPEQIAEVVSRRTGILVTKLCQNDEDRLTGLAERLHKRVIGQEQAVDAVAGAVSRSKFRLRGPQHPVGFFLFLGPTGGKTELAKALAGQLFDDENSLIPIDMSRYMEEDSVFRFIGDSPGYSGLQQDGRLIEAVRRQPRSVIFLDQVEKAHRSVLNTLLRVLDEGGLTFAQERRADFSNCVIIMTTDLGAEHLLTGNFFKSSAQTARKRLMQTVESHFRPRLLHQLDEIVIFDPQPREQSREVVWLEMKDIAVRLAARSMPCLIQMVIWVLCCSSLLIMLVTVLH